MCFPDMTHSKEVAAKPSLPRSQSVDLQSKKLKMILEERKDCPNHAVLLTQSDAPQLPD